MTIVYLWLAVGALIGIFVAKNTEEVVTKFDQYRGKSPDDANSYPEHFRYTVAEKIGESKELFDELTTRPSSSYYTIVLFLAIAAPLAVSLLVFGLITYLLPPSRGRK